MRSHRLLATLLLAIVAIGVISPFLAQPAYAHAALARANPANNETLRRPPARIVLNFSEALERKLTQIQVTDKGDNRFDDGQMEFDDKDPTFASVGVKTLEPGLYFVKWSNVSSVDGHALKGSYPFIVLNPDGTFPAGVSLDDASAETSGGKLLPNNLDVAVKWIALLSLATVAGAAIFLIVVIRPAAAFLDDEDYHHATDAGERWLVNLAHVLIPASFIAVAFLILLTWSRFDTSTSIFTYLLHLRTGQYRGIQMILLVLALVGADILFLGGTARKRNAGLGLLMVASVGAMLAYSMISHSAQGKGEFWAVASDFFHLLASSTWLGALVMLWPLLRWSPKETDEAQRYLYLANAADRFSILAGVSVIVVFATGTFNGLTAVQNSDWLFHTAYGKVLLAKLSLILLLMPVAGLNAFILKPRLVEAIDTLYQNGGDESAEQRERSARTLASVKTALIRTVAIEVALVVAVFASVAVLSQTSTARGEIAQDNAANAKALKFSQTAVQDDLKLTLEVTPNRVGLNQYNLTIQNLDGTPSTTVTQARLRFTYDEVQGAVAPSEIILNKFADGDYRGAGAYFTQPGNWRVEANVRRSDKDDVAHQFVLPVARAEATTQASGDDKFALPFNVFTWNEVFGVLLAIGGAVIIIYRKQLRGLQQPGYRIMITAATALLLAGAVLAFGVDTHAKGNGNLTTGNPVPPTQDSIDRGKMLFQANCVQCHGIDGRGDGPDAANLSPAPTDFRLHMPLHTDPQFFGFIANGYPGSAMPKFGGALSDTDVWNLVNYLRSAFTESPSQ